MLRRLFASAILLILLMSGYTNCMRSSFSAVENVGGSSLTGSNTYTPPLDGICPTSKPGALGAKVAADLRNTSLPSQTPIFLLIDQFCFAAKGPQSFLTRAIPTSFRVHSGPVGAIGVDFPYPVGGNELIQASEDDPCIEAVDLDVTYHISQATDPRYAEQAHLISIGHPQIYPYLFNAANGISEEIRVGVVDTGIDVNNPDLQPVLLRNSNNQVVSLNALNNLTEVADSGYHGTHVAGIIAAANNSVGVSGLLGRSLKLVPVKVSSDGSAVNMSAVVNGIYWAVDQKVSAINLSLGGPSDRPSLKEALRYATQKGVFIAVAAGNDGQELNSANPLYPALYANEIEGVVSVGAYDTSTGNRSSFSNFSTINVDILAPGSAGSKGILSTLPTAYASSGFSDRITDSEGTYLIEGTSMATPMVTGAAAIIMALARSRGSDALPAQVEKILQKGSDQVAAFSSMARNGSRLNLVKLVQTLDADQGLTVTSNTPRMEAKGKVSVLTAPVNQTKNLGESVDFTVVTDASSSVFLNYRWYKDGQKIEGQNGPTLHLTSLKATDSGAYQVQVYSGKAYQTSPVARLSLSGVAYSSPCH